MADYLYDKSGRVYRKVEDLSGGRILANQQQAVLYDDDEMPEWEDWNLIIMPESLLSNDPPKTAIVHDVKVIQDQKVEAQRQLSEIREQIREAEQQRTDLLERLKKHPPLAKLDAWINGNIRFIITHDYYHLRVYDMHDEKHVEALKDRDDYRGGLKLLSLKGEVGRGGSGVRWVFPSNHFAAMAETKDEVPDLLLPFVTQLIKDGRLSGVIQTVDAWNVPISQSQRDTLNAYEERTERERQARRKRDIDDLEKRLTKLKDEYAQ